MAPQDLPRFGLAEFVTTASAACCIATDISASNSPGFLSTSADFCTHAHARVVVQRYAAVGRYLYVSTVDVQNKALHRETVTQTCSCTSDFLTQTR